MIERMSITYYAGNPEDAFIQQRGFPTLDRASKSGKTPVLLVYRGDDLVLTLPYDDIWHHWRADRHVLPLGSTRGSYQHFIFVMERWIRIKLRHL